MKTLTAKLLVSIVCMANLIGAPLADYNHTHIFNPNWPPHAIFYCGQTISMSVLLGICSLFCCWNGKNAQSFSFAVLLAALYWITQFCALFFPGSRAVDPEFLATTPMLLGFIPGQVVLDAVMLTILCVATLLSKYSFSPQHHQLETQS